ncbi:MAG TPA: peptide deformylase [Actinomycetota bacterium]|jgi:peptide deformylase
MAVLEIRTFGDPVLRQRAREVEAVTDVHRRLVSDMLDTMREAPGVGLAGTQVGVLERVFVWEVEDEFGAVINPRITARSSETVEDDEGCLSLPGLVYPVTRAAAVTVEGLDADGRPLRMEVEELLARVVQHEIDHLDGVLFIDRLPEGLKREALRRLSDEALGLVRPGPVRSGEVLP